MGVVLGTLCFITHDGGTSAVGIPFGADFAGFYVAAQILDSYPADRLYDRDLHQALYHQLLPRLPGEEALPYVHPPFVAGILRVLSQFPYHAAVLLWMAISLGLYIQGMILILRTTPSLKPYRFLIIPLALAFEPFLFECLLGGQLSAVGFLSFAWCWSFLHQGRHFSAGMALGLCFYKPTLLLLLIPMLLAGRQWRILAGMTVTGLGYVLLSILLVGWECTLGYVPVLFRFQQQSHLSGELVVRLWKYVDIFHFWKLLSGSTSGSATYFGILLLGAGLILAGTCWWKSNKQPPGRLWVSTLFLVPVLNLYFGIYDSILVVQAVMIQYGFQMRENEGRFLVSRSDYLPLLLFLTPWFTQPLAQFTGIQVYTLVLIACSFACYTRWPFRHR